GGLEDRADLHLVELRRHDAEAAAAQAEHRVELRHILNGSQQFFDLGLALTQSARRCYLRDELLLGGQELVQGRVKQADDDGQAVHRLEDAIEVLTLERQQFLVQNALGLLVVALLLLQNGALELLGALTQEHVLGTAQTDAARTVVASAGRLLRIVGVSPDTQAADLVSPLQNLLEMRLLVERRGDGGELAEEHLPGTAVERDHIAFLDDDAVHSELELLQINVD